ncbi:MAG: TPM domain-containing protein [Flavobacteriales bacterium]
MNKLKNRLSPDEELKVENAILEAEKMTSCEIRVHIQSHCQKDVMDLAAEVFAELNMHKTAQRNGILIFIAIEDHQLAIIGDVGINAVVPENFWEDEKDLLISYFKREAYGDGLEAAILQAAKQVMEYFPAKPEEGDQLSNDISYGQS